MADGRQLPNLLIAGVHKAGTSSLFWYMSQHPDVCASDVKELSYFSRADDQGQLPTLTEYQAHFAHCGSQAYLMEGSPEYFSGGGPLARTVKRTLGEPRVIVSLRDPSERFISWYRFMRSRGRLSLGTTVEHFLSASERGSHEDRSDSADARLYEGVRAGFYAANLQAWFDVFGDNLAVVFFEDLVQQPAAVVRRLCRWLSIDSTVVHDFEYSIENRTLAYRNLALQRMALAVNRRLRRRLGRHRRVKRHLRDAYFAINGWLPDPHASEDGAQAARSRLHELYAADNRRLAALLLSRGYRELPYWLSTVDGVRT